MRVGPSRRLWCCKTLESPLDNKKIKSVNPKGNQSWIVIGRTDAEALILWPPDAKNWLIGKTLMLGKIDCRRRRGRQRMRWLDDITASMDTNLGKLQEMVSNREAWCAAIHRVTKSCTWLSYWTTMTVLNRRRRLWRMKWLDGITDVTWVWAKSKR